MCSNTHKQNADVMFWCCHKQGWPYISLKGGDAKNKLNSSECTKDIEEDVNRVMLLG